MLRQTSYSEWGGGSKKLRANWISFIKYNAQFFCSGEFLLPSIFLYFCIDFMRFY